MLGRSVSVTAVRRLFIASQRTMIVRTAASGATTSEGYLQRNKRMGRPMSPSLRIMISHPDMVWTLSVAHRTTGVILTGGVTAGTIAYLAMGKPFNDFVAPLQPLATSHPALWTAGKLVVVLPLCYHMVNGIRHLSWDAGKGFEMRTLYKSGYLVLTVTALLAGALALYKPT